jgi:GTPase
MEKGCDSFESVSGAGMKPFTIAIVGRANVGKSSLFNGLVGYTRSIVYDRPGTTLDEIGESVDWGLGPFRLFDTQGIEGETDEQTLVRFLKKSDVAIFVVDAISGPTPYDTLLAQTLKRTKKPVLLCVNKSESKASESELTFAELGFPFMIPTSAAHKTNLDPVREWCLSEQRRAGGLVTQPKGEGNSVKLALVGRPNTGKSTLMNSLCGQAVSRVSPQALTTRDPVSFEWDTPLGTVRLVDTAGMRRPRTKKEPIEEFSLKAATRTIDRSEVVFLMIASHEPVSDQDIRLLNLLVREGKPAAVLLNFWDLLSPVERKHFLDDSDFGFLIKQFPLLPLSGLTGWNVDQCLPLAFKLKATSQKRVKTSRLNRVVEKMVAKNPPPSNGRQSFNILYASQVNTEPPTFVFFMNRKGVLPASYQKYIEGQLRKEFKLKGQSLRVYFRGDDKRARNH